MKLGLVGLSRMGQGKARNLLKLEHAGVSVAVDVERLAKALGRAKR